MFYTILNAMALVAETSKEPSTLQWIIYGAVIGAIVGAIVYTQKAKSSEIPKKLEEKYEIKDKAQFGFSTMIITDSKIVVQSDLKWFEYEAADIKKITNVFNGGLRQFEMSFLDENGNAFKGPKVFGGGAAIKNKKSFFVYYHGGRNEKVEQQGTEAVALILKNFPHIEV